MKKILYYLPFVFGCILYIFVGMIGSFSAINPFVWIALGMLLISGFLMDKKKWWGSVLGILIGILLIYMGSQETGQIVSETSIGIIMCIYYIICGFVAYKKGMKRRNSNV